MCPAQAFCGSSTLTITYSSRTGWVRRMREAYRVVRSTPGVTTCSFCPWSPDWRAEWSSTLSPQTEKMSGLSSSKHCTYSGATRQVQTIVPTQCLTAWSLLHIHDKDLLPSLSPQFRLMCCDSYFGYLNTKMYFKKRINVKI